MKRCPFCAEEIQDAAIVCRFCHADLVAGLPPAADMQRAWRPGIAAILSLVIPGAGQIYKGHVATGIVWFVVVVIGYVAFVVPGAVLHLICIVMAASGTPTYVSPPQQVATPVAVTPLPVSSEPEQLRLLTVITTDNGDHKGALLPRTGRGYFLEVVGGSFYQDVLGETWVAMRPERTFSVLLTAEPENPYDTNAVAIQTFTGQTIGYFAPAEAERYQQLVMGIADRGLLSVCAARLVGGSRDAPKLGVRLDLEDPTVVAEELGLRYHQPLSS